MKNFLPIFFICLLLSPTKIQAHSVFKYLSKFAYGIILVEIVFIVISLIFQIRRERILFDGQNAIFRKLMIIKNNKIEINQTQFEKLLSQNFYRIGIKNGLRISRLKNKLQNQKSLKKKLKKLLIKNNVKLNSARITIDQSRKLNKFLLQKLFNIDSEFITQIQQFHDQAFSYYKNLNQNKIAVQIIFKNYKNESITKSVIFLISKYQA